MKLSMINDKPCEKSHILFSVASPFVRSTRQAFRHSKLLRGIHTCPASIFIISMPSTVNQIM
jgi:hypothetical protein